MSVSFGCRISRSVDLREIVRLRDAARESFPGFTDLTSSPMIAMKRITGELPLLEVPHGVDLRSTYIQVGMPRTVATPALFGAMLQRVDAAWSDAAFMEIGCHLANPDGSPSGDQVGIGFRRSARFFSCTAFHSFMFAHPLERRSYFEKIIDELDLPMTLQRLPDGYSLSSVGDGGLELYVADATWHNHASFRCMLPGGRIEDIVLCMQRFLDVSNDRDVMGYDWSLFNDMDDSRPMLGKQLYDWVKEARLPMTSGEVTLSYSLRDIEGLDDLLSLLGARAKYYSRICGFRIAEDEWVEMAVKTQRGQHRLEISLPGPQYRNQVERVLGVRLKDTGCF